MNLELYLLLITEEKQRLSDWLVSYMYVRLLNDTRIVYEKIPATHKCPFVYDLISINLWSELSQFVTDLITSFLHEKASTNDSRLNSTTVPYTQPDM